MATSNMNNNLLQQQQQLTSQMNQLMAQSSQALLCGPGTECERTKTSEDLQQKYLNAQTNLQTAPYEAKVAEKNYYVYTKGEAAYSDMQTSDLEKDATKKANDILATFTSNVKKATELNDTLSTFTSNNQNNLDLYTRYRKENEGLKNKLKQYATDIVTYDRKTYYEVQNYDILRSWYYVWLGIYFILLATFAIALFLTKSSYSFKVKIILLVIFLGYPFYINYVVTYLLKTLVQIQSLLPKNIYTDL